MANHPTTTPAAPVQAAPSIGNLVQPGLAAATPPANPQEQQGLANEWLEFFKKPEVISGLLQFSINAAQPVAPGQTRTGALTSGIASAGEAVGRVRSARAAKTEGERKAGLEERGTVVDEGTLAAQVEATASSERRTQATAAATIESAKIRAKASKKAKLKTLNREEKIASGVNPAFFAQLNLDTNEITTKDQSGKTITQKGVLDKAATAAAGEPVLRFASDAEIAASNGNLVPSPSGIQLVTTKDGVRLSTGNQQLPAATESRIRANVRSGRELLTNVGTLLDQVERGGKQVSGPLGAFKGLVNVTLASFIPALFSQDRALFERQLKLTRESSKRAVSDEERFTDQDRAYVQELFPTPGLFGNPQAAEAKLQVMTAFFLRRLAPDLEELGIDTVNVPTMEFEDLLRLGGSQLLTPSEIKKSAEFIFPEIEYTLDNVLSAMALNGFSNAEMEDVVRQLFPDALE